MFTSCIPFRKGYINESFFKKTNKNIGPRSNVTSVKNSSNTMLKRRDLEDSSANIIKRSFKRKIAAASYGTMFSEGVNFKNLKINLSKEVLKISPTLSLDHLNNLSKSYLNQIKQKTPNLTLQEKNLLSKVVDAKFHFRHQSNANLVNADGILNIMSSKKLKSDGVNAEYNTWQDDIEYLSNHDFVFFGVEFSSDESRLPLNTIHSDIDYGANAYIVNDQFPFGYLTLTDHFENYVPFRIGPKETEFSTQFPKLAGSVFRVVYEGGCVENVPIFSTKDMKLGLGLNLISFLRDTNDKYFSEFALKEDLKSEDLDKILSYVFQQEFHVPRMVSTNKFKKVSHRSLTLEEAVKFSNFDALSEHLKNKDDACEAIKIAIKWAKKDIVEFLFSKYSFKEKDLTKMSRSNFDIEYCLTIYDADPKILKIFLDHGLVKVNTVFVNPNPGDTMLNNAINNERKEMIDLLKARGALTGEEIRNQR